MTKTIPHHPVAKDVTLAACSAEDRLQSGSVDIQSLQHFDAIYLHHLIQDREHNHKMWPWSFVQDLHRDEMCRWWWWWCDDHYETVSTCHDDNICKTRFSVLCTGCL